MVNYGLLTPIQTTLMAMIVIVTNLPALPTAIALIKTKGSQFEGIIFLSGIMCSFMYHICQTFNTSIYLQELQWHRLDNIFVIASFSVYLVYLSGNKDYRSVVYSSIIVSILTQEKDPWNINYSVFPITFYGVIGFFLRIYNFRSETLIYNWNNLGKSLVLTIIGVYFFAKGLNEFDDYLRFNHGMWHLFAGVASWYGFQSVQSGKDKYQ